MNKIEQGIRQVVPAGSVLHWPLEVPPTGFLTCDGTEVSRATYPELWDFVDANSLAGAGLPYGIGDGSTTFDLPDGRGRFLRSPSAGDGGAIGGADTHSHTNPATGSSGSHSHTNPSTGSAGSHTHTNPSTATSGLHDHFFTQPPSALTPAPGTGADRVGSDTHQHAIDDDGSHTHTQGSTGSVSTHAHSIGDTDSAASHSHTQSDTASESSLQPFLELWMIVAT